MSTTIPTFKVTLTDGAEHVVQVLHADRLRAELEAPQHAIPTDPSQLPLATTSLWCWAAFRRVKLTTAKYTAWVGTVAAIGKAADDDTPLEAVGPTQQDQPITGP